MTGGMPPELMLEQQRLMRRQQMAEALMKQAGSVTQPQQGGRYVTPISPLAPLVQGLGGLAAKREMDTVDQGLAGLGRKYSEGLAKAIQDYVAGGTTTAPAIESPPDEIGGGPGREAMQVPADPRARVAQAMASPYAQVRQLGAMDFQMGEKRADRAEDRAFRAQEAQLAREARMDGLREQIRAREAAGQQANELRRELAEMADATRREIAAGNVAARREAAEMANAARQQKNVPKLPTAALKLQQEELEAIGTASTINADLGGIASQLASGKLKPSLLGNAMNNTLNAVGLSTEESRNLASFKSTLEKLRNDSLRLNKGVQTEGDAQRAWNEMIANINDKGVVAQRLAEIQKINERAANLRRMNIDTIRGNYGLDPMDDSGYRAQPAAVGANVPQNMTVDQLRAAPDPIDPLGIRKPK